MRSLFRTLLPAAALAVALLPAPASAQCAANGALPNGVLANGALANGSLANGYLANGYFDNGDFDGGVILSRPIGAFFEAPFGGYTLYAGQAGSGVHSASDYSHINYHKPPALTAQMVLDRLRDLGIPLVAPETQFLGKNPAVEGVRLPVPRPWIKFEEPKEKEKEKDKDKDKDGDN
jgi:hypothetical protein